MTHKIAVPASRLYHLDYSDFGAYWTFTANPNTLVTIVVLPELTTGRIARGTKQIYFYVRKGAKMLQYFATNEHWLLGSDGSKQQHVQQGNDYTITLAPKGMDGEIQSSGDLSLDKIYFANAPFYLAATFESLLLRREVAEKDGLEIRKETAARAKCHLRSQKYLSLLCQLNFMHWHEPSRLLCLCHHGALEATSHYSIKT